MQSDWLNSALSAVVYGDIAPSIKINTHTQMILFWTFIVSNICTEADSKAQHQKMI